MLQYTSKKSVLNKKRSLNCRGNLLDLSTPAVMGILNVTPDSFYDGGRYKTATLVEKRVQQMVDEGADVIDIGAFSTRPGAEFISETEEIDRLASILALVRQKFPSTLLSVDTFRASVARLAVQDFGVDIINDISAGDFDEDMLATVADLGVPYIAMHLDGSLETMHKKKVYDNLIQDMIRHFASKVSLFKKMGVNDVVLDPGFGFSKTINDNYNILKNLEAFKLFELPLLIGLSRKSMIWKALNSTPDESLNGTTALNMMALQKGASILRVHDVKEAVELVKLWEHCAL